MPAVPASSSSASAAPRSAPLRSFGRFRLLRLLGKSERCMCWLVADPNAEHDLMLVLPRHACVDAAAASRWLQRVKRAARLQHPRLAPPVEVGLHENWPFAAYDANGWATLADRIGRKGLPAAEAATVACDLLEGLAYAHDAGIAHHDLHSFLVLVDDQGRACVAGLEVAALEPAPGQHGPTVADPAGLQAMRHAAETDVLAAGLILHHALVGQPPLEEPDIGRVIARMPPSGHEVVRLPWSTGASVPEVLRTIANRAADRQERQRYRNARTLARALDGWLVSDRQGDEGPLAQLLERMSSAGTLPASPDGSQRGSRLAAMERQRTNELAATVVEDIALAFELLRQVNSAQARSTQAAGNGSVLTIRRAIAMLGMEGLRRAANVLKPWPGALAEAHVAELAALIQRVKRAARIAVMLRPAAFDAEVMALLTMLQNLGRLLVNYHYPDEAQQIRRLMAAAPPEKPGEAAQPGMTEESAAFSVIGVDIEAIGTAVARRWGLDEELVQILRRWPLQSPPRAPESDAEVLRLVASCANELVELQPLPAAQQATALHRIVQRYGRILHVQAKELQTALQESTQRSLAQALLDGTGNSMFSLEGAGEGESPYRAS